MASATERESSLDMLSVLLAYDTLLGFGGGVLQQRLSQATSRIIETLAETPFDELENLRVFLIIFL